MTNTRIYFAVPDHFAIGREFDTYEEAEAYALSTIREIQGVRPYNGGRPSYTRAFVDVRVSDRKGDRPIHREEIFNAEVREPSAPLFEVVARKTAVYGYNQATGEYIDLQDASLI